MPAPVAEVVSALVEEFTNKLLALLPAAAAAELDALTFQAGSAASPGPSANRAPGRPRRSPGAKARRAAAGRPKGDRAGRPSSQEASRTLDAIAALLRERPGLGGEEIRRTLGRTRGEVRSALALGLWTDALRSEGEEQTATYLVGPGGGGTDARTPE